MKKTLISALFLLFAMVVSAQPQFSGGHNTPPLTPATIPYSCNFEDLNENAQWQLSNSTCTNQWFIGAPSNIQSPLTGNCLYISNDNGTTNAYTVADEGVVTVSRLVQFSGANEYILNFDLIIGGEGIHDYIKVFVVDVDTNYPGLNGSSYPYYSVAAFNTNQYLTNYNGTAPYFNGYNGSTVVAGSYPRQVVIPNQGPAGTIKKLIILWKNDTSAGTMPPASIDNISIVESLCARPSAFTASNSTINSIDLNWTENGSATTWNIQYKKTAQSNWTTIQANTNPFTISNLSPSSIYNFRIQSDCGTAQSAWTNAINASTLCGPTTQLPWREGFESTTWLTAVAPGNGTAPYCWYNLNGGASTSVWRSNTAISNIHSGIGSAQQYSGGATVVNNDWLVSPIITLTGNERLTFWAKGNASYKDSLSVYIYDINTNTHDIQVITDSTLFTLIMPNTQLLTADWFQYEIPLNSYIGDFRIAFVRNTKAGNYINLDDVEISTIPTCQRPTAIYTSNILSDQAEINFTPGNANSNLWWLYFKPTSSSIWDSIQISSYPYTLTNLTPNTNYQYYFRTDCNSEFSEATNTFTFLTNCASITQFPWTEGFEETTWPSAIAPGNASAPSCWKNFNGASSSSIWQKTTTAAYIHSGTAAAQQYASSTTTSVNDWLISPPLTLSGTERISFWTKASSSADQISLYIYDINGNGHDISAMTDTTLFVNIMPNTLVSSSDWTRYEVNLSNFMGNFRIAFVRNTIGGSSLYIDDVVIDAIPACYEITNLSEVSATQNSITLNWIYSAYSNQGFELSYANQSNGFDPATGTIINIPDGSTLPFTISNLTPGQYYSFAVRQACGGTWSNIVVTNTLGVPATLPYSNDFSNFTEQTAWKFLNGNAVNRFYIGTPDSVNAPINADNLFISSTNGVSNIYNLTSISTAVASRLIEFDGSYGYVLNFDVFVGGESSFDYLKVFLTDPDTTFFGSNSKPYFAVNTYNGNNQLLTNYNNTAPYFNGYNGTSIVAGSYPKQIILPSQGAPGTIKKLIFVWTNDGGGGTQPPVSIDNITLQALSCPVPEQIFATNLTTTSTTLTWTDPSSSATQWHVKWKTTTDQVWNEAVSNTNSYSLSNLVISTPYNVQIATICGNDTSVYAPFYFATPCDNISIPYTQNFDSGTGIPSCWTRKVGATNPNTSTTNIVSSPNSFYFYANNTTQYAALPPVDPTVSINTLQLSFKMYITSASYQGAKIGIMSDPNNMATFQQIGTIVNASPLSTWQEKIISLDSYTGNGRFIAIVCDGSGTTNGFYIDDLEVSVIPTCPKPQLLTATTTNETAQLSWTESGSASQWEIEWGTESFVQGQGTLIPTTNNTETITNLTQNTIYKFYVRSICGVGDTSLWTGPFTFKTQVLNAIPNVENFLTTNIPAGYTTTGWTIGAARGVTGNPGNNIYKNIYSTVPTGHFITANYGPIESSTLLNFDYKVSLYSSPYDPAPANSGNLIIAVSNDWGNTFTNIDTVVNNGIAGYQSHTIDLSMYANENIKIKFIGNWALGDYDLGIDNIYVGSTITCFPPTGMSVSNYTSTSVDLNWNDPQNATSWNLEYGPTGFTPGTGTIVTGITSLPYTITNLTPQTTYQFFVQSACSSTDNSLWSIPTTFSTNCSEITSLPWVDYFDSYTTGSGNFPVCWRKVTSSASYPYISTTNSSTPASMYFYVGTAGGYNYAATPMFDPSIAINTLKAEFKIRIGSNDDTLYVGVMTNPLDTNTFELVAKVAPSAITTWTDMDVFFNNYTGNGHHIAFKTKYASSTSTIYLDNLEVFTIPSCLRPTQLTGNNATTNTIDLSWQENGAATSWNIEYGPSGFTPGNGTSIIASSNPFTLNSLTNSSCYDFYVQAVCSASDLSVWSHKGSFCTSQIPAVAPVTIDFESPSGFQMANTTTANSWVIGTDTAHTVNNTTGGQNALYISNDNGLTNAFTITTANVVWAYRDFYFTNSTTDYTLTFNWKAQGESTYDFLNVYIGEIVSPLASATSTITAPSSVVTLATNLNLQGTWQTATFTLPAATYAGQTKRLFFCWKNDGSGGTQPPVAVDNISITSAGLNICNTPTNLNASTITSSSAQINWTAGGTETEWELDYKLSSGSSWSTVNVLTTPSYTLGSLLANSSYDYRVRAKCSATSFSDYTSILNFSTTSLPCLPPTNVTASNITESSAIINWAAGSTETSWQVEYKLSSSSNWTIPALVSNPTITLQALQSNSTYDLRVKSMCNPGESVYSDTYQFTTNTGIVTYVISTTVSGPGTITPSGNVTILSGANQLFTFTPNTGCVVTALLVDNISIPNPGLSYQFDNVTANHSLQVTFATSGIEDQNLTQLVELYPNPTNATIEIHMNETQLHVKECRVYDIYGKLMSIVPVNADNTKIDATDFAAGVYFIRMNSELGVITKKFVKK